MNSYGNVICHHGVRGQKWGIRRYQNKYGALTIAGQRRKQELESQYNSLSKIGSLTDKGKKKKASVESEYKSLTGKSVRTATKKKVNKNTQNIAEQLSKMTDDELRSINTRQQLEQIFKSNQSKNINSSKINKRVTDMTDDELRDYNNRKQMEEQYAKYNQPKVSKGKKFLTKAMNDVITPVAIDLGKAYLKDKLSKQFDIPVQNQKKKDKK